MSERFSRAAQVRDGAGHASVCGGRHRRSEDPEEGVRLHQHHLTAGGHGPGEGARRPQRRTPEGSFLTDINSAFH